MDNVIVLIVPDAGHAPGAMSRLHRLHGEGALRMRAAAVVEGAPHGLVGLLDDAVGNSPTDIAARTTVAALLEASGGPLGLVVDGAAAVIVRALVDIAEAEESGTVVAIGSRSFPPRKGAILAIVAEATPRPLDGVAADVRAALLREPRADVERELIDADSMLAAQRDSGPDQPIRERQRDAENTLHEPLNGRR